MDEVRGLLGPDYASSTSQKPGQGFADDSHTTTTEFQYHWTEWTYSFGKLTFGHAGNLFDWQPAR